MSFLSVLCAVCILLGLRLLLQRIYRRKVAEETITAQIPLAGVSRNEAEKIRGTVVICGGSIAGLLSARICHDHFERVVILEREAWLNTEDARLVHSWKQEHRRASVIQYYSLHSTLALSFEILKNLFPDIEEQCAVSGISVAPGIFRTSFYGHPLKRLSTDRVPNTIFCSRRAYETLLRRLVLDKIRYPNIEQITGTVTEIHPTETNGTRVGSVSLRKQDGDVVTITGECFIDCTGSTQGLTWLNKAGYGQPDNKALPLNELRITYDPKIRYNTMEFPVSSDLLKRMNLSEQDTFIYSGVTHPWKNNESVYAAPKDGRFIHLCAGTWGGKLPNDLDEFIRFNEARYKENPDPENFIRCLDLLHEVEDQMTCSKIVIPPCAYIRYHLASGLPSNWVAMGDSVMTVNPVFGQGTTKAAIGAICLNALLHESKSKTTIPEDLSRRFFQLLHQKTKSMWDSTRASDYGHTKTIPAPGETLSYGWFLRWYIFRLMRVGSSDADITLKITEASHVLIPGIDLLLPSVVWKVLWDAIVHPLAYHI